MPFIVFEGIDGAGKSTLIEAVAGDLRESGTELVRVREPGGTALGERVRELLLGASTQALEPWTEACLFTAARVELVAQVIAPALEAGRTVLADRFAHSTLAYQGLAGGLDLPALRHLQRVSYGGVWPDRVYWLDLPISVALQRRSRGPDRIESRGRVFLEAVAEAYERLAIEEPEGFRRLDATQSVKDLLALVKAHWPVGS